jgi:hypothetical protein
MTCLRCDGLMVHETFEDLDGLWSSDHELPGGVASTVGQLSIP